MTSSMPKRRLILRALHLVAEIPQRLCHSPVHRRALFRLYGPVEFKRAKAAEAPELHSWIVKDVVEPLDEIAGTIQKVSEAGLLLCNVVSIRRPESVWQVGQAALDEAISCAEPALLTFFSDRN
jgi:hypothetical protein